MNASRTVYTVGHSNVSVECLLALLGQHQIGAVADVRSQPYSRFSPQFNRPELSRTLAQNGISYIFLGHELGARYDDPACQVGGRVIYSLMAKTPLFESGIRRVERGMESFRLALLCAEKDPLACHRSILIGRHLCERNVVVRHILEDGTIEDQAALVRRLLASLGMQEADLFRSPEELSADAYELQARRIQFVAATTPASDRH